MLIMASSQILVYNMLAIGSEYTYKYLLIISIFGGGNMKDNQYANLMQSWALVEAGVGLLVCIIIFVGIFGFKQGWSILTGIVMGLIFFNGIIKAIFKGA